MFFFGAHGGGLVQVVWFRAPCSLRSAVPQAVMIPLGLYRNGIRELAFYRNCSLRSAAKRLSAYTFRFIFFFKGLYTSVRNVFCFNLCLNCVEARQREIPMPTGDTDLPEAPPHV
jgi:hypothetical protein